MKNHGGELKRGDCLSLTNLGLLGNPLDFIHEDHLRERETCAQLDSLASAETPDANEAACVLTFLRNGLPLHLEDEQEDLFPLLKRRCKPEEKIDRVIARLSADHRRAKEDTPAVVTILEGIEAANRKISNDEKSILVRYSAHARRHLTIDNAIIQPFARLRLTDLDLETLRLRMMERRGLDRLVETTHAE
jgi:iron-sulfur cluster repair protein YtfE (RIC family)